MAVPVEVPVEEVGAPFTPFDHAGDDRRQSLGLVGRHEVERRLADDLGRLVAEHVADAVRTRRVGALCVHLPEPVGGGEREVAQARRAVAQGVARGAGLGDVHVRAGHAQRLAVLRPLGHRPAVVHPDPVTVAVPHAALHVVVLALSREDLPQLRVGRLEVVRVREPCPRLDADRREVVQGAADDLGPALVEHRLPGLHVPLPGAGARSLDDAVQPPLALLHLLLGPHALPDAAEHGAEHRDEPALLLEVDAALAHRVEADEPEGHAVRHHRHRQQAADALQLDDVAQRARRQGVHVRHVDGLSPAVGALPVGEVVQGHVLKVADVRLHALPAPLVGAGRRVPRPVVLEHVHTVCLHEAAEVLQRGGDGAVHVVEGHADVRGRQVGEPALELRLPGGVLFRAFACGDVDVGHVDAVVGGLVARDDGDRLEDVDVASGQRVRHGLAGRGGTAGEHLGPEEAHASSCGRGVGLRVPGEELGLVRGLAEPHGGGARRHGTDEPEAALVLRGVGEHVCDDVVDPGSGQCVQVRLHERVVRLPERDR